MPKSEVLNLSNDLRVEFLDTDHERGIDKVRFYRWVHGQVTQDIAIPIEEFEKAMEFLGDRIREVENRRFQAERARLKAEDEAEQKRLDAERAVASAIEADREAAREAARAAAILNAAVPDLVPVFDLPAPSGSQPTDAGVVVPEPGDPDILMDEEVADMEKQIARQSAMPGAPPPDPTAEGTSAWHLARHKAAIARRDAAVEEPK